MDDTRRLERQLLTRPVFFAVMGVMKNWNDLLVYMWSEKRSLHCIKQNISALLWYPSHGDVLHLSTPATKEVKSLCSRLGLSGSGQRLKKSLLCLWHSLILATYSLVLSSLYEGYEEGLQFHHKMATLPAKWDHSGKAGSKPQERPTISHSTRRFHYPIWMPVVSSIS